MNYGELIRDAFFVALRNRFLWVFGFFIGGGTPFVTPTDFGTEPEGELPPWALSLFGWAGENVGLFVVIMVVLVLLIVLISATLVAISSGALAESVASIDRGEERRFSSALRAGLSNFWRVLGQLVVFSLISLGIILALYIPAAAVFFGTFALTESVAVRILVVLFGVLVLFVLLVVIFVPLAIISQLSLRELVVGQEGVLDSIGDGYRLFRRNLGRCLILLLIQIGLALGVTILLSIITSILGLLMNVPVALLSASGPTAASITTAVVLSVIVSVPFIVLSGTIGTFNHAYWTLAYLRLTTEEASPQAD